MSRAGYDMQTRQRLVTRVINGERITAVCRDSGVSYSALHEWVNAETKGRNPRGENCPRCGATPSHQKHKLRTNFHDKRDYWAEVNPVDGFICPYCNEAFRVNRLESESGYIVDWQTEYEFTPRFCPNCGASLEGKLSTDVEAVKR